MKISLRFTLLTVALMLFGFSARAGSITEEQAKAKAKSFLQKRHPSASGKRLAPVRTLRALQSIPTSQKALYVFNVGENDGFVIVSGDDRTRPVLGFADSGTFDADHMPAALNEMLAIYARQIDQLTVVGNASKRSSIDSVASARKAPRRISSVMADVAPLLTTTWNQGSPYNDYCPTLNDQTALTGCVATAMAQIAYYHKYPTEQVPSLAAYTSATNKINVTAWGATTFDWSNMLNSYDGSETNAKKAAVATLMRYCGQAAQMDYGFTSGAYNGDALYAFKEKLGYQSNASFKSVASYSINGWEDLIYKEVHDGRPVYYSALNGDGSNGEVGGHAFVIDGYKADGNYFHVNWGWGGACDGFFNLFALDPNAPESPVTTTGWHYQMLALIGLSPETVNTAKLIKDASGSWLITSTDDWNELSANLEAYNGGTFKLTTDITVTTMVGTESVPFTGIFDGQGHTIAVNYTVESFDTGRGQAPFSKIAGALIKNLHTTGIIKLGEGINDDINAAGIAGYARGDASTIQNCWSSVNIDAQNAEGDHGIAGILGSQEADVYIIDCLFDGSLSGNNSYWNGGFVGFVRGGRVTIVNSLQAGTFNTNTSQCGSFVGNEGGEKVFENCYFLNSYGEGQGVLVTADQLADGSITRKLQSGSREWTTGLVWGQKIGTDAMPMLTSDASKGIYKVAFSIDGQVLKTIFTNSPIGDKMPAGEDFGLKNATFTCNGTAFTSTTPFSSDITVVMTGTTAYTLKLGTPDNGTISINNNASIPGILKKITAIPANGYKVGTITVNDANGKALPVTQISNNANEFVFVFPKSSVTVNAEFTAGEAETSRFINGGLTLPSADQPWTADTWTIWCDEHGGDKAYVGTPPVDAFGHQWYEESYALTNSDADAQPNGNKVVWENHSAFFGEGGNYEYLTANGGWDDRACNFYFRRIFTFNNVTKPSKLYLWFRYDDGPASFYLNGTLIYENGSRDCIDTSIELTPEQVALIHTDGTPNVLAAYCTQVSGPYYIDCGLYDPTAISYEVTSDNTVRVLRNAFITGNLVIPSTVTANGKTYTVTELGDDVFNYCQNGLNSVSLPSTLTGMGNNIFWECPGLQYVKSYLPVYQNEWLIAAPANATELELPMECQKIWNNAFKFTEQLTKLTLQRPLSYIGSNAFVGCTALTNIYSYARPVPQTEDNAFEGIDKSKITVHVYASALDSYKQTWGEEFNYVTMTDPQQITLTVNVTEAGSLRSLIEAAAIDKGSSIYDVVGITVTGSINQDDLCTLSDMCTGVYSLTTIDLSGANIEGNYIGGDRFRSREKLTSIILPETLEYIEGSAFRYCNGLTSIDIPASVKRIAEWAFDCCQNLATVTGMEGLSEINCWSDWDPFYGTAITQPVYGGSVFLYMPPNITGDYEMPAGIKMTAPGSIRNSQISSIILPASLTHLGDDTFQNCQNLGDIYCYATTPPECTSGVWEWDFDRSACTVHVPVSAVEDYKNAGEWNEMGRIVGIVTADLVDMTLNIATAGTLNDDFFDAAVAKAQISDKILIRNLTITGNINADDVAYLNTLPNTLYNMVMLDLSGATLAGNAITERMFYAVRYKAIKLPTAVTSIADEAFRDSRRLREITLPESLKTIGSYAFAATALANITLPETIETISRGAFEGSALNSITVPASITQIEPSTFGGCSALTTVTFEEGSTLKRIEEYAFSGLTSLKSITLPVSLQFIGNHAFARSGLTSIIFPDSVTEMQDRILQDCGALISITIGNLISYVPERIAEGCNSLEEVTIGKRVREIWWAAFPASNIKHVYCHAKTPPAWIDAFYGDINTNAVLHVYSKYLDRYESTDGWKNFPTIVGMDTHSFDLTVKESTAGTFSEELAKAMTAAGCEDVVDIDKLTIIGVVNNDDFDYFRNNLGAWVEALDLSTATIENNSINESAFWDCVFKELELPDDLLYIGRHAFTRTGLTSISIPESVTGMGDRVFQDCRALTSITIGNQITSISECIAEGCNNLEEITLGKRVREIWWNAFPAANIKHVYCHAKTPPSWIEAFNGDINTNAVLHVYSKYLDRYESTDGWKNFPTIVGMDTHSFDLTVKESTAGTFSEELAKAMTAAGCEDVVDIDKLTIIGVVNNDDFDYFRNNLGAWVEALDLSTATIENNSINESAFWDCVFKELELPDDLLYIGRHAFTRTGLTSISIPESVTGMGDRVFQDCRALTSITIGNQITSISECIAEGCNNLEEITLGKRVREIWWNAFPAANIKHVYCHAKTPPSWIEAFNGDINTNAVLHVYSKCVDRYKNTDGWKNFPTIVGDLGDYPAYDIAVNVPTMGSFSTAFAAAMAAAGCDDVMYVSKLTVTGRVNQDDLNNLRDKVGVWLDALDLSAVRVEGNFLGDNTLSRCGFEELILPTTITHIGGWSAIEYCANLKTLNIPNSVRYVGPVTLNGATSLETVTGGDRVTEMEGGNGAYFDNCPNLKSPVILNQFFYRLPLNTVGAYEVPDHVTTIARDAMWNVSGLTALTLPESINTIYANAFCNDTNLKDIYFYALEVPGTDDGAFNDFDRAACTLHVYEEMVEVFKSYDVWAEFNIVGDLGTIPILTPMNEADYADLCNIFNTLDGNNWRNKWATNNNVQTASRWRGVTFDADGYVTSIEIGDNGLSGNIGELTFTGLTKLTSLNMSGNALSGDIMAFKAKLPSRCKLYVERQDLGEIGEHTLYKLCNYGGLPSIAYYRSESGSLASTLMGLGGNCRFYHQGTDGRSDWEGQIYADGGTWENYQFYWPSPVTVECIYPHRFTFTYSYEKGDANMDDQLNVLDLQSTLNYSNGQSWGLFNFCAADTYGEDDDINVQDIVATVNILLSESEDSSSSRLGTKQSRVSSLNDQTTNSLNDQTDACLTVENGEIALYTTKPVAALDLRLAGIEPESINWNTESMGFATATTAQADGTRAIIYSMMPREMEEGKTVLANFDASLSPMLVSAVLSDSKARPISVGMNMTTGIGQMEWATGRSLYDLQGCKVDGAVRKGVYIMNGKKVVIK